MSLYGHKHVNTPQTVTAERTSYSAYDGAVFTDNNARKVGE